MEKSCHNCGKKIKQNAIKCKHCKKLLIDSYEMSPTEVSNADISHDHGNFKEKEQGKTNQMVAVDQSLQIKELETKITKRLEEKFSKKLAQKYPEELEKPTRTAKIATATCHKCHRILPRTQMKRKKIKVVSKSTGISGGIFLPMGQKNRNIRVSSRSYFRYKEVWICSGCSFWPF